jgi:hypothetical protein
VQSDVYIGDGANYGSRFRFVGSAKISPTMSAGFLYEFGVNNNAIQSMNQSNGGDDLGAATAPLLRDSTVWLRHSHLGMVKVGHGSTATDNLILIDLGGMAGAGTSDIALYSGSFRFRNSAGAFAGTGGIWQNVLRGHDTFDTTRRNHVLYETPALAGFTVQAAVGEDNYWDVALRYAGEFGGFRLAFGIGYQEDTEFNLPPQSGAAAVGFTCTGNCDLKATEIKGSASILHVATGLFVTAAAGQREMDVTGVDDAKFWYVAGGIRKNFFGFGDTVLFGEYYSAKDMLVQSAVVLGNAQNTTPLSYAGLGGSDEATVWGVGVNQYIDAAAMEVFLVYKQFDTDLTLNGLPVEGFQAVLGGARVNF